MAGNFGAQPHLKKLKQGKNLSSEAFQESPEVSSNKQPAKISLKGILGLGQSVDIQKNKVENQNHELFFGLNHLAQEQNVLFDQHQKQLEKELEALRDEISKLTKATDNLEKDVANAAISGFPEANEYQ
jgi:archaellum component FlaC